jgi:hypothetical protein
MKRVLFEYPVLETPIRKSLLVISWNHFARITTPLRINKGAIVFPAAEIDLTQVIRSLSPLEPIICENLPLSSYLIGIITY